MNSHSINTISNNHNIDENILIKNKLLYGDLEEIINLFENYNHNKIRKIWEKILVPNDLYYATNCFIAKMYFKIENPDAFIKNKSSEILNVVEKY